jgi:hypothetical protein
VQLKGGVGEVGDEYERHADEVADRVVRGESAEALLDGMAGAPGPGGATVQHRKGDFASLRKSGAPVVLLRYKDVVYQARVTAQTDDTLTLALTEEQHAELPLETVESDAFELLDAPVRASPEAEKRIGVNKQKGLVETFGAMVETKGVLVTEEHLAIVRDAHQPGSSALAFAQNQVRYQKLLMETFHLSMGEIMNVHRSAGYEYEFGRFYDPERPEVTTEPELLRSHVTLALSPVFSGLFEGRAAHFRLETDSRNCLELVTPPFLSLVCGDTGAVLLGIHKLFAETTVQLGYALQAKRRPVQEQSDSESEDSSEKKAPVKEKDPGVPIFEQLGLFGAQICDGTWNWVAEEPVTKNFCFAYGGAKHGTKAYGQANISMTPEEIILTAALLPEWNGEESSSGVTTAITKSVPTKLSEDICSLMWGTVENKEDQRLRGAVNLYARATSNVVALPSILYRQTSGERPEEGNLATEIKETLLLWVKDFPHTVIADCLFDTESAGGFIGAVKQTEDLAWQLIDVELKKNLRILEEETRRKVDHFASREGYILPLLLRLEQQKVELKERQKIALQLHKKQHPCQLSLLAGIEAARNALAQAEQEYRAMVGLHLATLAGKPYVKRHTKDENVEEFGSGYGVRKDTYLDRAPGDRRLRVAEIRDTQHLERLSKIL